MSDILGVCKKHGSLTSVNSYTAINQYKKQYIRCFSCREEKRISLCEKVKNNSITKNCKRHGLIKSEKIRVNTRATLICKICDIENSKKSKNSDKELFLKKCKNWRKNNPEKMRQYGINYKPKRAPIAKKLRKKWLSNPEYVEKLHQWQRKSCKKAIENISDAYVSGLIKDSMIRSKRFVNNLQRIDINISKEIIELKKAHVKLIREIKRRKNNG
jgi:hypothetical protein